MKATLNASTWDITFNQPPPHKGNAEIDGFCDDVAKIIIIKPDTGVKMLDTAIHEMLHALFPKAKERKVTRAANQITSVLWKMNYRKVSS